MFYKTPVTWQVHKVCLSVCLSNKLKDYESCRKSFVNLPEVTLSFFPLVWLKVRCRSIALCHIIASRDHNLTRVSIMSTVSIIFIIWTTKVFRLVDCQRVRFFSVLTWIDLVLMCAEETNEPTLSVWNFPPELAGFVGRRCLLASPVFHYAAGHHGAAATLC